MKRRPVVVESTQTLRPRSKTPPQHQQHQQQLRGQSPSLGASHGEHGIIHPADPWSPSFKTAFKLLLLVRLLSAIAMPFLSDCDEVFNYWEPMHYLQYKYGQQTWEYAPENSIRSWSYILLYFVPAETLRMVYNWLPGRLLSRIIGRVVEEKVFIFYGLRGVMAVVSASIESMYYKAVVVHVSSRIGRYLLLMLLLSPGMFFASSAFLPSTTAMYSTMLVITQLLKSYTIINSKPETFAMTSSIGWPIFWIAFGAIYAWPFSGAIGIPLVFEEVFIRTFYLARKQGSFWFCVIRRLLMVIWSSLISAVILLSPVVVVDFLFYRQWTLVPWNIVAYNVFNRGGGPNLYGTEPWWFYIVNGILNFNIAFPLALLSIPVVWKAHNSSYEHIVTCTNVSFLAYSNGRPYQMMVFKLLPVYFWLFIFTLQPHKEERFLFVIYPLICFNAAVSIAFVRGWLVKRFTKTLSSTVSKKPFLATCTCFLIFGLISVSRILAIHSAYRGSVDVYHELILRTSSSGNTASLCLSDEWYRFPSHYLLPDDMKLHWKKKKNGFDGLLPKYFEPVDRRTEHPVMKLLGDYKILFQPVIAWLDERSGTFRKTTEKDFNTLNKEILSRYDGQEDCTLLVEYFPSESSIDDYDNEWTAVKCIPFLDRKTPALHRAFFIPYKRKEKIIWGQYCLLEKTPIK